MMVGRWKLKSNLRLLLRRPMVVVKVYACPLTILLVGAMLDVITTIRNINLYGSETEVHLAVRTVIEMFGPVSGMCIGKIVQLTAAIVVACFWRRWCGWLMVIAGVFYALAAVSNYFLLL